MKKLLLITVLCLISANQKGLAQDKIVKLNGESISCELIEIGTDNIKYKNVGESVIYNISTAKIQDLVFESGKIENINNRVIVQNESDWEKVQIVTSETDVEGLQQGEELKITNYSGMSKAPSQKLKSLSIKELKMIAASKGYHTLIIVESTKIGVRVGKLDGRNRVSVTGIGYSYVK